MSVDEEYLQKVMRTLSHDLGAALRAASGFSALLEDGYRDQLDEKALHWLSLIRSEGELAQEKLKALSRYARLHGIESEKVACSLEDICRRVIREDFVAKYPDFSIDVDGLPVMSGYDFLWVEFFRETIKNSVQHSGGNGCHIYQERDEKWFSVIVEDHGCGVPVARLDNIMLPLRSLSGEGGLGMGLSVMKRIIELHGGMLLLNSAFLPDDNGDETKGFRVVARFPVSVLLSEVNLFAPAKND